MLKFEKFDRSPFQQELVRVFEEAFPPAERPPLRAFLPCTRKPGCVLYAVSEGIPSWVWSAWPAAGTCFASCTWQ